MDNIVSFERKRETTQQLSTDVDIRSVILSVLEWAEVNGVDATNDIAFQVRLADFTTYLELAARDEHVNAIRV